MVLGLILVCLFGMIGPRTAAALSSEGFENAIGTSNQELLDRSTLHLLVGLRSAPETESIEPVSASGDTFPEEFPDIQEELDGMNTEGFDESLSLTDFEAQIEAEPPSEATEAEFDGDSPENMELDVEVETEP